MPFEETEEDRRLREAMVQTVRMHPEALDQRVLEAMARVPRHLFVAPGKRAAAYVDHAMGIGHGQTISAPHMVAIMCTLARVHPGARVLEVGTGSGYHAAVLAQLARPEGGVVTVESVPELAYLAKAALEAAGAAHVEVRVGDGAEGAPDVAPFDVISVAAASPAVPDALTDQLAVGGRMVIPVGRRDCDLVLVERTEEGLRRSVHGRCVFVPLTGPHGAGP